MPAITGTFGNTTFNNLGVCDVSGAFSSRAATQSYAVTGAITGTVYEFNASKSSPFYGSSATVTPASYAVMYYLKY